MAQRRIGQFVIITATSVLVAGAPTWAAKQGSGTSTLTGGSPGYTPDPNWTPYGEVIRGSSYYGATTDSSHPMAFLGLAAKGNIVIGDYTNTTLASSTHNRSFDNTLEMIDHDGIDDTAQPYVPDPTDSAIGYNNDPSGATCGNKTPCFNGDYTANDGGQRCANASCTTSVSRRFYESSLSDDVFRSLVQRGRWWNSSTGSWVDVGGDDLQEPKPCFGSADSNPACRYSQYSSISINATMFTNHAIIGDVGSSFWYGALVARDDALGFQGRLDLGYDWRLQDPDFISKNVMLPLSLKPASVQDWKEVPPPSP